MKISSSFMWNFKYIQAPLLDCKLYEKIDFIDYGEGRKWNFILFISGPSVSRVLLDLQYALNQYLLNEWVGNKNTTYHSTTPRSLLPRTSPPLISLIQYSSEFNTLSFYLVHSVISHKPFLLPDLTGQSSTNPLSSGQLLPVFTSFPRQFGLYYSKRTLVSVLINS